MGKFRLMKFRDWVPSRIQHFFQLFTVGSKLGQIREIKYYYISMNITVF